MKYKVEIIESLAYTYVIDAPDVETAKLGISAAYRKGTLPFPEDKSELVACEFGNIGLLSPDDMGDYCEVH